MVKSTAYQVLNELFNMSIVDIPEGLFHLFKLVTFHLYLFYLLQIAVELAQSDFLAGCHLKVTSLRFIFRFLNLHCMDGGFADLYHVVILFIVFIVFIVVGSRIRRDEEVIRIPNVYDRGQQIPKGSSNFVFGLEHVRVWQDVLLRYNSNGASDEEILVKLSSRDIVAVEFKFQTSRVIQNDVLYNGGPDGDSEF